MTTTIRLIRLGQAKHLTQGGGLPIVPEEFNPAQRYTGS
jgi:hypothetical protein